MEYPYRGPVALAPYTRIWPMKATLSSIEKLEGMIAVCKNSFIAGVSPVSITAPGRWTGCKSPISWTGHHPIMVHFND